jgi:hypothetical protein
MSPSPTVLTDRRSAETPTATALFELFGEQLGIAIGVLL